MATSGIIGQEIDKQAELASTALENIFGAAAGGKPLLPRAILDMLGHYSAALYIAERVIESATFDRGLVHAIHSKLLPLERTVDERLIAARASGYFDDSDLAEPLRWLETCNEQVKDCMVALESMLEPKLDGIMAASLEEHQRGETVPLDSIR